MIESNHSFCQVGLEILYGYLLTVNWKGSIDLRSKQFDPLIRDPKHPWFNRVSTRILINKELLSHRGSNVCLGICCVFTTYHTWLQSDTRKICMFTCNVRNLINTPNIRIYQIQIKNESYADVYAAFRRWLKFQRVSNFPLYQTTMLCCVYFWTYVRKSRNSFLEIGTKSICGAKGFLVLIN